MSNGTHSLYYEALDRLKKGHPRVVMIGTQITNDAVSLEAGRKKGSIKKSRPQFNDLIAAIAEAAAEQSLPQQTQANRLNKIKQTAGDLREQLDAALARENSLVIQLYDAREKLAKFTGEKVMPIRRA